MNLRNRLEKQRNILDFSLQNLIRRKGKSLFILVIFVLLVSIISSILFLTGSLTREMIKSSEQLPDITIQKIKGGRQVNIESVYLDQIERIPGIEAAEPRAWGYFYLDSLNANFTIFGFDLSLLEAEDYETILTENTKQKNLTGKSQYKMAVGPVVYEQLKKSKMQETYLFFNPDWETSLPVDIIGVFKPETELQSADLMLLQTDAARKVLELSDDEFTDIAVYIPNPEEVDNIALKIRRAFPELRTITRSQIQSTYSSVFGWKSGLVLSGLLVVILAFLVLIWDRSGGLSQEEKREIGVLKAIGWDTEMVLAVKFLESLILSSISAVLGILVAYVYIYWLRAPGLREVFIGWSTIYPSFKLVPYIDLKYLMLIVSIAIVPYSAVSIVPAWRAAITDPDEIIRHNG